MDGAQCFGTVSQLVVASSYDIKCVFTWCQRVFVQLCVTLTLLTYLHALRSSMYSGNEQRDRQPRLVHASDLRPIAAVFAADPNSCAAAEPCDHSRVVCMPCPDHRASYYVLV